MEGSNLCIRLFAWKYLPKKDRKERFQLVWRLYSHIKKMFMMKDSVVTLLFEHSLSWASEIEHCEIFSHPQENQLARQFFVKFNLLLFFLIS